MSELKNYTNVVLNTYKNFANIIVESLECLSQPAQVYEYSI